MAGYSGTPLLRKLGIKSGFRMAAVSAPAGYLKLLGPLPEPVRVLKTPEKGMDFIHLFASNRKEYGKQLPRLKKCLAPSGMIWVSWPKAASKVPTDMNDNVVRDFALKNGLVDIKVCAVDETWSGLKLVIPVKDRK
jgi:hypothetical protein